MAQKHEGKKVRGVFFRRGSWWARWFEHGRERVEKCDTKSQAVLRHAQHRADIREGIFFPRKSAQQDVTLRQWIRDYLEHCTNRGRHNEVRYGKFWSLYMGQRLLAQITSEDFRKSQSRMRGKMTVHNKTKQPQRAWSDSTINRYHSFIRHLFSLAVQDGKISRNPMSGIKFFPEEHRTRFLNEEELTRLRNVLPAWAWVWVCFAIETGLRQSEMFGLRWEWVDLDHSVLTVPLSKSGKTRHVPLSEGAKSILRSFDSFVTSPFVFPSKRDPLKPLGPRLHFSTNVYRPRTEASGDCRGQLAHAEAYLRVTSRASGV